MITVELSDRRAATEKTLDRLLKQQGSAVLDGKPFDHSQISVLERELDAISAAEAEAVRRDRAELEKAEAERLAGLRHRLHEANTARLEAWQRAQVAGTAFGEELKQAFDHSKETARLARALGQHNPVYELDAGAVAVRAINRVSHVLRPIMGTSRHFGGYDLPEVQERFSGGDWSALEEKIVQAAIDTALKG